ncbi:hypothetical protein CFP56_011913 [Quercus suber]|uniref:Uncharacterized protein n=1 Tax=Quercus suber TaxID=58331 RepID=A0AAW0KZQ4_QUESU
MCFSKLFPSRDAFAQRTLVRSELETPLERKNSILGKRVFSGLVVSTCGNNLTSWEIWVLLKPFSLRRLSTESGLSGFSKCTFWDVKRADFGDNPHEFMSVEDERKERGMTVRPVGVGGGLGSINHKEEVDHIIITEAFEAFLIITPEKNTSSKFSPRSSCGRSAGAAISAAQEGASIHQDPTLQINQDILHTAFSRFKEK